MTHGRLGLWLGLCLGLGPGLPWAQGRGSEPATPSAVGAPPAPGDEGPAIDQAVAQVVRITWGGRVLGDWFVYRLGGDWLLRLQDLRTLPVPLPGPGAQMPAPRAIAGELHLGLSQLPGLVATLDEARWVLDLALAPTTERRGIGSLLGITPRAKTSEDPIPVSAGPSGFLNWHVVHASRHPGLGAGLELGARWGTLRVTGSVQALTDRPGGRGWVRGPTAVFYEQADQRVRWTLGDVLTTADPVGGGLRLIGLSVARWWDPDPSVLRDPLQPAAIPIGPLQAAYSPLRPGLQMFEYALGRLHRPVHAAGSDEGPPVLAASHRWGWRPGLTLGLRAELTDHAATGGPQAQLGIGPSGLLSLGLQASRTEGPPGTALARGQATTWDYQHQSAQTWVRLGQHWQSADFQQATESPRRVNRDRESYLALGYRTPRWGHVSIGRTVLTVHPPEAGPGPAYKLPTWGPARHSTTVSWSAPWPGRSGWIRVSYARLHDASPAHQRLTLGLTWVLGGPALLSTTHQLDERGLRQALYLARPAPRQAGWGGEWQGHSVPGQAALEAWRGSVQWQGSSLRVRAEAGEDSRVSPVDRPPWSRLSASGSLSWVQGQMQLGRPIDSAWAVVRVGQVAGVVVRVNGVVAGSTDAAGRLLLTGLPAYQVVTVSLDPTHLPLEVTVTRLEHTLRLPDGGGAVLDFGARRADAAEIEASP